jgi:hypothetical protein
MTPPLRSVLVSLFIAAIASAFGCLDFTPLTAAPSTDADAGADAMVSIPSLADVAGSPCFQCVSGATDGAPSCKTEYAACDASPKCSALFRCGIPRGCYRPGENIIACLTECGRAAGLTGIDDPAVGDFFRVYNCATTTCAASCSGPSTD